MRPFAKPLAAMAFAGCAVSVGANAAAASPADREIAFELGASMEDGAAPRASLERAESLVQVENDDPALLINLGIAHAARGDEVRARELFEAARDHAEPAELRTAGGRWVDSERLAREALAMLDEGAFAPTARMARR